MRKFLLFIVAIVSLNMIMPQKASAQEELPDVWRGDICYYLEDAHFGAFAIVSAFSEQLIGHVIVPDTVEYRWSDHPTMWPVIGVSSRILYNRSITSLDLPATINNVRDNSFSESETLNSLIIRAEVPPIVYDNDFNEVSDTDIFNFQRIVNVYVPDGSVQAYKDDSNWGKRPIFPISQYQAIDQITNDELRMTNKVIRDGHLLIERNGKTYNAQGAEVR